MQITLEDAFSRVTQEQIHVVGSGRTDAGAHATCQVIAFSTTSRLPVETLQRAANALLPRHVAVTSAREVDPSFHPRFDATSRVYRYVIWNRPVRSPFCEGRAAHVRPPLDVASMHSAAQCLVGRHDFGSFVPANFDGSRERTVFSAECRREGDTVTIEIDAEGFMRQMVRSIAGTLIDVGRGAVSHSQFRTIMLACDRATAGRTAPAHGLYLVSVHYADGTSLPMQTHSQPHHVTGLAAVATQEKR